MRTREIGIVFGKVGQGASQWLVVEPCLDALHRFLKIGFAFEFQFSFRRSYGLRTATLTRSNPRAIEMNTRFISKIG